MSNTLDPNQIIEQLHSLRQQPVDAGFWRSLAEAMRSLCRAERVVACQNTDGGWQPLVSVPEADSDSAGGVWPFPQMRVALLPELFERAMRQGYAALPAEPLQGLKPMFVVRMAGEDAVALLLQLPVSEQAAMPELLLRARLLSDLAGRESSRACEPENASEPGAVQSPQKVWTALLEQVVRVWHCEDAGTAELTLVNGLASWSAARHVCLGWRHGGDDVGGNGNSGERFGGYVQLRAFSHSDRFERNTRDVKLIESAFEECVDQNQVIRLPAATEPESFASGVICQSHQQLMDSLRAQVCLSVPLFAKTGGKDSTGSRIGPQGCVLLILDSPLNDADQAALELALELVAPCLQQWQQQRRSAWQKAKDAFTRLLSSRLGAERPWSRLIAIIGALMFLFVVFGSWTFRVDATGQLETDHVALLSAPFDGYVRDVPVQLGQQVEAGEILASLDSRNLLLEQASIEAEIRSANVEADKARANYDEVGVEIASAQAAQAEARLRRVRFYLQQANLTAPFAATVVEGERQQLLGVPVKQGQGMFRLARIDDLYLRLQVSERDVHFVETGAVGEFALLAEPGNPIAFEVTAIVPMAQVNDESGNHYVVLAKIHDRDQLWWRPGMSGLGAIEIDSRPVYWVMGHRLWNRLRLALWW